MMSFLIANFINCSCCYTVCALRWLPLAFANLFLGAAILLVSINARLLCGYGE